MHADTLVLYRLTLGKTLKVTENTHTLNAVKVQVSVEIKVHINFWPYSNFFSSKEISKFINPIPIHKTLDSSASIGCFLILYPKVLQPSDIFCSYLSHSLIPISSLISGIRLESLLSPLPSFLDDPFTISAYIDTHSIKCESEQNRKFLKRLT